MIGRPGIVLADITATSSGGLSMPSASLQSDSPPPMKLSCSSTPSGNGSSRWSISSSDATCGPSPFDEAPPGPPPSLPGGRDACAGAPPARCGPGDDVPDTGESVCDHPGGAGQVGEAGAVTSGEEDGGPPSAAGGGEEAGPGPSISRTVMSAATASTMIAGIAR